jgi:hypothetical protein
MPTFTIPAPAGSDALEKLDERIKIAKTKNSRGHLSRASADLSGIIRELKQIKSSSAKVKDMLNESATVLADVQTKKYKRTQLALSRARVNGWVGSTTASPVGAMVSVALKLAKVQASAATKSARTTTNTAANPIKTTASAAVNSARTEKSSAKTISPRRINVRTLYAAGLDDIQVTVNNSPSSSARGDESTPSRNLVRRFNN